jgi:hypothetical protein
VPVASVLPRLFHNLSHRDRAVSLQIAAGAHLQAAYAAAIAAVTSMAYGDPAQARTDVHKGLAVALKSGTPAKKMAAAQALAHVLAPQDARAALYRLQIAPALVALCASGVRLLPCYHHLHLNCRESGTAVGDGLGVDASKHIHAMESRSRGGGGTEARLRI